jgi:toxin ParE1/3/4
MDNRLIFSPEAQADLEDLYLLTAERAGETAARALVGRIDALCSELGDFPERGTRLDDLFPGLRLAGFAGQVAVAYHIGLDTVTVDRILHDRRRSRLPGEAR